MVSTYMAPILSRVSSTLPHLSNTSTVYSNHSCIAGEREYIISFSAASGNVITVGSGDCDVALPDPSLSRVHAKIAYHPQPYHGFTVEDCRSSAGTYLRLARPFSVQADAGATFKLGRTVLTIKTRRKRIGGSLAMNVFSHLRGSGTPDSSNVTSRVPSIARVPAATPLPSSPVLPASPALSSPSVREASQATAVSPASPATEASSPSFRPNTGGEEEEEPEEVGFPVTALSPRRLLPALVNPVTVLNVQHDRDALLAAYMANASEEEDFELAAQCISDALNPAFAPLEPRQGMSAPLRRFVANIHPTPAPVPMVTASSGLSSTHFSPFGGAGIPHTTHSDSTLPSTMSLPAMPLTGRMAGPDRARHGMEAMGYPFNSRPMDPDFPVPYEVPVGMADSDDDGDVYDSDAEEPQALLPGQFARRSNRSRTNRGARRVASAPALSLTPVTSPVHTPSSHTTHTTPHSTPHSSARRP
jgi:hypothetical protein